MIQLPASIILSTEGLKLFQDKPETIRKVQDFSGYFREGLQAPGFNGSVVQKMIMNSMIEGIHLSHPEFLSHRHEIISTTNLVVYAILYRKLSPVLGRMLLESSVVKTYNRTHPSTAFHSIAKIDRKKLEILKEKRKGSFERLEGEIRDGVIQAIISDETLSPEDRDSLLRSLDKFILWMDQRIWYLYYVVSTTPLHSRMRDRFIDIFKTFLDTTRIGTHLSNLVMEFVQNAERAHFHKLIRDYFPDHSSQPDLFLRDRENREKLKKIAEKTGQVLQLCWEVNRERSVNFRRHRIGISISNYGAIDEKMRQNLTRKMKSSTGGLPLSAFFNGDKSGESLGAGLGLLYNSYLEDICRGNGIGYSCNIYPELNREKTTARIEVLL